METTAQPVLSNAPPAAGLSSESPQPLLHSAKTKLPWWAVSVALHVLVITLAGLISMAIELPRFDDPVIMTCVCIDRWDPQEYTPPPAKDDSIYVSPSWEPPAQDEKLTPLSEGVVVTDEALGNPDAHLIMDATGTDSLSGGSGNYGATMEDLIGLGGQSTAGTGWGWGGGDGHGLGADPGNGMGAFGSRSGGRGWRGKVVVHCAELTERTNLGLEWLALHQERDGHWNTQKFGAFHQTDTAVTSLGLLAFLGAGHSEKVGEYQGNVRRAVRWLKQHQQGNGMIFDTTDAGAHRGIGYPVAMATLALAEAAGMGNLPDTKNAAQRAVDYCVAHQSGTGSDKGGWRYTAGQAGDLSVTGWYVMALKSAKMAKLHVPVEAFEGALKFLDSVDAQDSQHPDATRFLYRPNEEHAESSHRLTAIGTLARIFLGVNKESQRPSVEAFVERGGVPEWSDQKTDLYYWYYGSLATFQMGGDVWRRWNEGMVRALNSSQITSGENEGSWPVVGAFSDEWGRAGQTALATLCMEVYYRYEQVK